MERLIRQLENGEKKKKNATGAWTPLSGGISSRGKWQRPRKRAEKKKKEQEKKEELRDISSSF